MNLAVITACAYHNRRMIHFLEESCAKQEIALMPYAIGEIFRDWSHMIYEMTRPELLRLKADGYTHFLALDGVDSIVVSQLGEFVAKYENYGSPKCLMSAECEMYPAGGVDNFTGVTRWKYLNGGGYIAEITYFVELLERLRAKYPDEGNYQAWFVRDWPIDGMVLDAGCEIFQSMPGDLKYEVDGGRLLNLETHSVPCVLHFRGGYVDPHTGRDERMRPVWEQLYGGGE